MRAADRACAARSRFPFPGRCSCRGPGRPWPAARGARRAARSTRRRRPGRVARCRAYPEAPGCPVDALVLGDEKPDAAVLVESANDLAVGAREHVDDRAL